MTTRIRALWAIVLVTAGVAVGWSAFQSRKAQRASIDATARLARVESAVTELDSIAEALPAWALAADANADTLAKRAGQVVAAAGLPASSLSSFTSQSEPAGQSGVSASAVKLMRKRATLVLSGVTLPQLGGVLAAWKSKEPEWSVSSLDLGVDRSSQSNAFTAGGDLPLRTVLTLESYALASQTTPGSQRSSGGKK